MSRWRVMPMAWADGLMRRRGTVVMHRDVHTLGTRATLCRRRVGVVRHGCGLTFRMAGRRAMVNNRLAMRFAVFCDRSAVRCPSRRHALLRFGAMSCRRGHLVRWLDSAR